MVFVVSQLNMSHTQLPEVVLAGEKLKQSARGNCGLCEVEVDGKRWSLRLRRDWGPPLRDELTLARQDLYFTFRTRILTSRITVACPLLHPLTYYLHACGSFFSFLRLFCLLLGPSNRNHERS